jgi:histidinol-phosphatase (PHP family)
VQTIIQQYFGGDGMAYAKAYYQQSAQLPQHGSFDIIAHFDLLTKFNSDGDLFDTKHPRYLAAAEKALEALLKTPAALEVNYGAIARGYTQKPYPETWVLERWLKAGKPVCFSSDCHNRNQLLFGYSDYKTLIAQYCK